MRAHGVLGASISLDSTDRAKPRRVSHLRGSWTPRCGRPGVLSDAGLDFSLHMSVTDWNVAEVPAMIDLAEGARREGPELLLLVRTAAART